MVYVRAPEASFLVFWERRRGGSGVSGYNNDPELAEPESHPQKVSQAGAGTCGPKAQETLGSLPVLLCLGFLFFSRWHLVDKEGGKVDPFPLCWESRADIKALQRSFEC